MTSRLRARWVLKRLTPLLLCIGFVAAYEARKAWRLGHPEPPLVESETTGTCLDRRVGHLHVVNVPLEQVVDDLSRQTGQPIKVEWDRIHPADGSPRQAKVTIDLNDVTLYSALQTALGAAQDPVRYGVSHGVITVSSERQEWDAVARMYDVSDLLRSFSNRPDAAPAQPADVYDSYGRANSMRDGSPLPQPFTTGCIGPSGAAVTPRSRAMHGLVLLICSILVDNQLDRTPRPSVTQYGERLIVVAAEPQQHRIEIRIYDVRSALRQGDTAEVLQALGHRIEGLVSSLWWYGEFGLPVVEWDGLFVVRATPLWHRQISQLMNPEQLEKLRIAYFSPSPDLPPAETPAR
jgi:hypothetical protein